MPIKGDDFDALIAANLTEHQSNVCFAYTAPGQNSSSNVVVQGSGSFDSEFASVVDGMASHGPPTLNVEDLLFCRTPLEVGGDLNIPTRGRYKVAEIMPSGRGRTALVLRQYASP